MTESQSTMQDYNPKTKKVSIQERSTHIGDFIIVNGNGVNRSSLKKRFTEGGYVAHETPHFLLFVRAEAPSVILAHWFTPEHVDTNISHYLVEELKPFDVIRSTEHHSQLFAGIVGGTLYPGDVRRAWNYFGASTLQRLLVFTSTPQTPSIPDYGTLSASALLYQRVCELCVGERFLDAACNGGFLSLLLAERMPFVEEAVGVDLDASVFHVAQELATERGLTNVRYEQADLLADNFFEIGQFDTVTALHALEHFREIDMYQVLTNLLKVTTHRLIVAVPFEKSEPPEVAYGHLQLFHRAKLEAVGEWCVQHLEGHARMWYEDFIGGLLLIERRP